MPFGTYSPQQVTKSRRATLHSGVDLQYGEIDAVRADEQVVAPTDGREFDYDMLIIATGVSPRPDQTDGMLGPQWRESIHEFYSYEGSVALAEKLRDWEGGRLVVNIVEMTYVTPLPGAFTKPIAAEAFGNTLEEKSIDVEPDFMLMEIDDDKKALVSYDEREVPFDKFTQLSTQYDNIFALGDANDIPASKAGSVAHFEIDVFVENFLQHIAGKEMTHKFDGHANCFIETGGGKAMLIDFNYDYEPLPGKFPYAGVGPMNLLKESRVNHLGKLAFRWIYWNVLMPGRSMPMPALMSLKGKRTDLLQTEDKKEPALSA